MSALLLDYHKVSPEGARAHASGLSPEIAMFVQWSDEHRVKEMDWYIKPSR